MAKTAEEKAAAKAAAATTATPGETPAGSDPSVNAPEPSKTEVTVKYRDHKGEPTERTFSKEVHGKDYVKLADEFRETNKSRIIIE